MALTPIYVAPVTDINLLGVVDTAPTTSEAVHAGTYIIKQKGMAGSTVVHAKSIVTFNKYRNDYQLVGSVGLGQRFIVAGYSTDATPLGAMAEHKGKIVVFKPSMEAEEDLELSIIVAEEVLPGMTVTCQYAGSLFAYTEFQAQDGGEWEEINSTRTKEIGWIPTAPTAPVKIGDIEGIDLSNATPGQFLQLGTTGSWKGGNVELALTELTDVNVNEVTAGQTLVVSEAGEWSNVTVEVPTVTMALADLTDVTIEDLQPGQKLTATEGGWINQTDTVATVSLSDLTDVDLTEATANQVLTLNADGNWTGQLPQVPDIKLSDLADVTINELRPGQKLVSTENNWTNTDDVPSPLALSDLTDVQLSGLEGEDFLQYDPSTEKWIPAPAELASVIVVTLPVETDIVVGDLVSKSNTGDIVKASITEQAVLGVVFNISNRTAVIITRGRVKIDELAVLELVAGDIVYMDPATPGKMVKTRPSQGSLATVVQVGLVMTPTEIDVNIDHQPPNINIEP